MLAYCTDLPCEAVAQGAAVIREGSQPGRLWVLRSGSVTIERDGVAFARIDAPGAVFGEMSWVLDKPATATVRAATEVEVYVIEDPETWFREDRPEAALTVLRMTAARLDGLTRYLVDVKTQFAGMEGTHLGMVDRILDTLVHHQISAARTGSARDPEGDHHSH